MEHKYSTFILLFFLGIVGLTMLVNGIEGFGTKNVLSKFDGNDLLVNSSLFDNMPNGSVVLMSTVCTTTNGLCSSGLNNITNVTVNGTVLNVLGILNVTKTIQASNYSSADGTIGYTGTCTILGLTNFVVKNGLIVGCS